MVQNVGQWERVSQPYAGVGPPGRGEGGSKLQQGAKQCLPKECFENYTYKTFKQNFPNIIGTHSYIP